MMPGRYDGPGDRHDDAIRDQFAPGDDEDFPDTDEIIRAKWTIDGATTLAEAAEMTRAFAARLQVLHDEGYVLREPVEDDYAFYHKPGQPGQDQET